MNNLILPNILFFSGTDLSVEPVKVHTDKPKVIGLFPSNFFLTAERCHFMMSADRSANFFL